MNKLLSTTSMAFSKKTFAVAGLAAAISLAGCSSDNPDEGGSLSTTAVSGTAVDGYIAGATVYVDYNNNGRKNAGEPSAITDKDGYFSTAKDGTDYCADDATALQTIHCLKTSEVGSGFVLRTFGGFDLYTGEPFTGSLSRRVAVEGGVVENQMISPLTSLLVDLPDGVEAQTLLDIFGLAENTDLDADFLDDSGFTALRVNSAIKLHKIVTLFSEVFNEQYEDFGQERSFPETPNAIIYKALAASISGGLNITSLEAAFDLAQSAIADLYLEDEDLSYPGDIAAIDKTRIIDNAVDILALINITIPDALVDLDVAKTRVIGVETVLKKMLDGDADVASAITEASDITPTSALYTAIDAALAGGDIDFTALTDADFAGSNYPEIDVTNADSFADLANKQLFVSFSDSGASGSGYFFFNSEPDASGGELKVCLKYDDGDAQTIEFEETEGVLLSGNWLSLNDSRLILNLAGSLTLSLADKGLFGEQHRFSLSYGGETRSWLSDYGLQDELTEETVEQPTDDASCETLLNPPQV